jgi:Na+-translocating ferredoxin:NAD+ oxidoreductase RnfG subunit
LSSQVDTLTAEKEDLSGQVENLSAEKDTLTEQVTALSASEADVQALTQENQELQTSNDALTEEVASLQATVETLEAEVETLRAGQPEATEEMVASAKGFTAGEVTVRVTMDQGVIATLTVETPNETPGFGTRCSEDAFTSQFIGKSLPLTLGDDVDAVSGATVTSQAVVDALNSLAGAANPS